MFYQNDYITKNISTQKMNEYLLQSEKDRLLLTLNPHQRNPLVEFARTVLHGIGHLMLTIGRRLDQLEVPSRDVKIGSVAPGK